MHWLQPESQHSKDGRLGQLPHTRSSQSPASSQREQLADLQEAVRLEMPFGSDVAAEDGAGLDSQLQVVMRLKQVQLLLGSLSCTIVSTAKCATHSLHDNHTWIVCHVCQQICTETIEVLFCFICHRLIKTKACNAHASSCSSSCSASAVSNPYLLAVGAAEYNW